MSNPIKVTSEKLQKAINHLIEYIKEQFNWDLNNEILNEEQLQNVNEVALEVFDEYAIYDHELLPLASELYAHDDGYNILEKAVELNNTDPLIINSVLKDFVCDQVMEHQQNLKKEREQNQEQEHILER